jgi:hypothetical protein
MAVFGLAQMDVWGAAQYGLATVEQGEMTILREGKSLSFRASPQAVPVNERDLVRVRDASRIVLKTQDKATMTLGANAVFQCEPWQTGDRNGTFRMLFGRFRAQVVGLAGGEHFNVKTATATIGVKGTEYTFALASNGNAALLGVENVTTLAGRDGVDQPVGPNQVSTVIGGKPATPAVSAPEGFKKEMGSVDSPPAGSPAAANLPAQTELIDRGVMSREAVQPSREGPQTQGPARPQMPTPPTPSINLGDAQQASQILRGKLNLGVEK